MKKVVICLISLFVILLSLFVFKYLKKEKEIFNISFLSSNTVSVDIYNKEFKEEFKKVRGTKVKSSIKEYENNNIVYKKIILDNNEYYVNKENLVSEKEKIIQEKELYIRTSTIIYKEPNKQFITSSIKKGEKVDINRNKEFYTFFSIGELNKKNNQIIQLEAMIEIIRKYPQTQLIISGDGKQKEYYEHIIEKCGLRENVKIYSNSENLHYTISEGDCFISTAKRDYFPIYIIKMMFNKLNYKIKII